MKSEEKIRDMSKFLAQLASERVDCHVDEAANQMLLDFAEVLAWVLEDAPIREPIDGDVVGLLNGYENDLLAISARTKSDLTGSEPLEENR